MWYIDINLYFTSEFLSENKFSPISGTISGRVVQHLHVTVNILICESVKLSGMSSIKCCRFLNVSVNIEVAIFRAVIDTVMVDIECMR